MKTKKYLMAIAIFGGMLFLAQAATQYTLDAQETAIKKKKRETPPYG